MIGVKVEVFPDKVGEAREVIRKFSVRKIYRMSGFQKAVERDSMKHAPKGEASPRGTPPYTHGKISKKTGKPLPAFPQTIRFKVEEAGLQSRSVVGPTKRKENWAERIGKTHEFGGVSEVEKRVIYRPARDGEKRMTIPVHAGWWLTNMRAEGKNPKLFKPKRKPKDSKPPEKAQKPEYIKKDPGTEDTFRFDVHRVQNLPKGRIMFKISYKATYPKRPFAAPALRKTIAATRQGKFG